MNGRAGFAAMVPIVDVHSHYIASDPKGIDNFRRLVESDEVCRVVVCALDLKLKPAKAFPFMAMFRTTNEQLAAMIEKVGSPKLVPFCHVDPRKKGAAKEVERWVKKEGMRGVKLYPPSGWYPDEPRVLPTFQAAEALGVPVLIHMGRVASHPKLRSKFARPLHLEDVGLACPKLKLIIGHFAAPWSLEAVHLAMGFPEWRFDLTTSGSWDMAALKLVVELHAQWGDPGIKRLVLGTDGSGADNLKLARETLDRLRKGGFTEPQLAQIAHRNGLDVLNEVL